MASPVAQVAITGRPNVGKSTMFNRLIGDRLSVEDDAPSTTRDRVQGSMTVDGERIQLMDTGGIVNAPEDQIEVRTQEQVEHAFESSALVVFVVSMEEGLTAVDRTIANRLRDLDKPILLVANKEDAAYDSNAIHDFHELGLGKPVAVSALHRTGLDELRTAIKDHLPDRADDLDKPEYPQFALIGRQNAGKSTFLNALAGSDRAIVSDEPGTTRDLLQCNVQLSEGTWSVVDTPGMVRRGQTDSTADMWSQKRIQKMIRRADVVLHLIDATEKISRVDKRISELTEEALVPHIPVINKWDLVPKDVGPEEYSEYLYKELVGTRYSPISIISAKKEFHLFETLYLAVDLFEQSHQRVTDEELTEQTKKHVSEHPPPAEGKGTTAPEVHRVEQVGIAPPHIQIHVNDRSLFPETYARYLENAFREWVPYSGIPIRIDFVEAEA